MNGSFLIVAGGDKRSQYAAKAFEKDGFSVYTFALGFEDDMELFKKCDILILPLPVSKDDIHLFAPLSDTPCRLCDIFDIIPKGCLVFGGMVSSAVYEAARQRGFSVTDYYKAGSFTEKNITPSCEGALATAIMNTPFILKDSNILITGYGRMGKLLAKYLKSLGACVHIAARKQKDIEDAQDAGLYAYYYDALAPVLQKTDILFNTVPSIILKESDIALMKDGSFYIELASAPGGASAELPSFKRIGYIKAPGLPGKTAPLTSGEIIENTVSAFLNGGLLYE